MLIRFYLLLPIIVFLIFNGIGIASEKNRKVLFDDGDIKVESEYTGWEGNTLKVYYRGEEVFTEEFIPYEITLEDELDIDKDGRPDILWISYYMCGAGISCAPTNLFVFINKGKPKFIKKVGFLDVYRIKKYVEIPQVKVCKDRLLIDNDRKRIVPCGPPYLTSYFTVYRFDLDRQALIFDKKITKKLIKALMDKLGDYQYVYVFYTKEFLKSVPFLAFFDVSENVNFNDGKIKVLDLSLALNIYKAMDVASLYSIASYVDEKLAERILNKYFVFENKKAKEEFKKKFGKSIISIEKVIEAKERVEE